MNRIFSLFILIYIVLLSSASTIDVDEGSSLISSEDPIIIEPDLPSGMVEIQPYQFAYQSSLISFSFDDKQTISSIGEYAFAYSGIKSLDLSTTTIKQLKVGTFTGCTSLTEIVLPESLLVIEDSAFFGCSALTSINLPNSLLSIHSFAFYGCSGVQSIIFSKFLRRLGSKSFYHCDSLNSVTFGLFVEINESSIFSSSEESLITLSFVGDSKMIDYETMTNVPWTSLCKYVSSIEISNDILSIGNHAFSNFNKITEITLPSSVTSIGASAFNNCKNLKTVVIDGSVEYFGVSSFSSCEALEKVLYQGLLKPLCDDSVFVNTKLSSVETVSDYVGSSLCQKPITFTHDYIIYFVDGSGGKLEIKKGTKTDANFTFNEEIRYVVSFIKIDSSIEKVDSFMFTNFNKLSTIQFGSGITNLQDISLENSTTLKSFEVYELNENYFVFDGILYSSGKTTLYKFPPNRQDVYVELHSKVNTIYNDAFRYNKYIEEIFIKNDLTLIGDNSFADCPQLNKIMYFYSSVPECGDDVFKNSESVSVEVSVFYQIGKDFCGEKVKLAMIDSTYGMFGIVGGIVVVLVVAICIVVIIIVVIKTSKKQKPKEAKSTHKDEESAVIKEKQNVSETTTKEEEKKPEVKSTIDDDVSTKCNDKKSSQSTYGSSESSEETTKESSSSMESSKKSNSSVSGSDKKSLSNSDSSSRGSSVLEVVNSASSKKEISNKEDENKKEDSKLEKNSNDKPEEKEETVAKATEPIWKRQRVLPPIVPKTDSTTKEVKKAESNNENPKDLKKDKLPELIVQPSVSVEKKGEINTEEKDIKSKTVDSSDEKKEASK